jgi:hypothetical protein
MLHLKFKETKSGFQQVLFEAKTIKHKRPFLYCFQYEGPRMGFIFYRCSLDGEPSHEVDYKKTIASIDFPNESPVEKDFLKWAKSEGLNFQPNEKQGN